MWYIILIICICLMILRINNARFNEDKPFDKNLQKVEQGKMSKVFYKDHSYVVWSINDGGGIVHDPDCVCLKK